MGSLALSSPASQFVHASAAKSHLNTLDSRNNHYWWSAIGDSFSAGPGAGEEIEDGESCYRFDNTYPEELRRQINQDTTGLFKGLEQKMKFKLCTGAKIPEMIAK